MNLAIITPLLLSSPHHHREESYLFKLFNLLCCLFLEPFFSSSATASAAHGGNIGTSFNISIPDTARFNPQEEEYICTVKPLNSTEKKAVYLEEFIYSFSKHGSAHHFLLYGCQSVGKYALDNTYWPCKARGKASLCSKRKHIPLGIPQKTGHHPAKFPENVAYGVGPQFDINYLMLEVHFLPVNETRHSHHDGSTNADDDSSRRSKGDESYTSGVLASGSTSRPKYFAGMMVMAGVGFIIPHGHKNFSVDINCQPALSREPIYPYAYWVHTHELGLVVSGYKVNQTSGQFTELARWSHRWPQPVILDQQKSSKLAIFPGDIIIGKCIYDSSNSSIDVHWGPRHGLDEMCNLFLFYFTLSSSPQDLSISCVNERFQGISKRFPPVAYSLPT